MSEPLISVVIPCYNHGQYIDEAIKSVEESKYQDFEIIIINTCAADHMVPGMPHMGDETRRVGKPYQRFMFVIGPYMTNYYEAAAKDKVQLGDPAKGELMISEGASDYVPPTKMEDWVWPYPKK